MLQSTWAEWLSIRDPQRDQKKVMTQVPELSPFYQLGAFFIFSSVPYLSLYCISWILTGPVDPFFPPPASLPSFPVPGSHLLYHRQIV